MQLNLIRSGKRPVDTIRGMSLNCAKKDKTAYKLKIKENKKLETQSYTNELHKALLKKHGSTFWKAWNAKFNNRSTFHQIDEKTVTLKFAEHFAKISSNNSNKTTELLAEFTDLRSAYVGSPLMQDMLFSVELVDSSITSLSNGKAPGLNYSGAHPAIDIILTKLFNLMIKCGIVPDSFGHSYSVPIPKGNCSRGKSVTVDISDLFVQLSQKCSNSVF